MSGNRICLQALAITPKEGIVYRTWLLILLLLYPLQLKAEAQRQVTEKGEVLLTHQAVPLSPVSEEAASTYDRIEKRLIQIHHWMMRPFSSYIVLLTGLALLILYLQYKVMSFFVRLFLKLIFIGLVSAVIYTTLMQQSPARAIENITSALPNLSESLNAINRMRQKQQEGLNALFPTVALPPETPSKEASEEVILSIKKENTKQPPR